MDTMTNRNTTLTPRTSFDGPMLTFDFPGLEIGVAEYEEGPTGCTVFSFPGGAATAIDERGGWVGRTIGYEWNHAICLAGGSLYGLEAAAGVSNALFEQDGYSLKDFPLVSGSILYDFGVRENRIYPDLALGRAALLAARPGVFPLGARGAGRSAGCGAVFDFAHGESSGQGGAFRQVGATKIAVFSVVNALGVVLNRQGEVVRGNRDPQTGLRAHPREELERRLLTGEPTAPPFGNTTLTVTVTNQKLDKNNLNQWARQVHSSMARIICPFHTMMDGDMLYAVTTNEVEHPTLSVAGLGMLASELLWDAILGIYQES
ncbi:MAG TPA: P1 family peptidase [Ktedonobacterales bacterium]|nr:P1 family peptidase [Ktedonobacterales bacterium]